MPIDESAMPGQKIGTLRAIRRGQDAVAAGLVPEVLAELVEKLARRVRPALERQHERRDPLVVLDELVLAGVRVVDAIDVIGLQRGVVLERRSDVVPTSARLVQIVIQVRAGRHEAVDVAVRQEVRDQQAHAAGAQRARECRERSCSRLASIFSQMRRAVARLRPWNETRSMRASISSAVNPGSAEKGCTGTRRKRD